MITRTDVDRIAKLARLQLNDCQANIMTAQLGQILEYVEQLQALDTESVEPLAHPFEITNAVAEDIPEASLPRDEALSNAPHHDGECYRVPAVL